jgi:hypothetical protein
MTLGDEYPASGELLGCPLTLLGDVRMREERRLVVGENKKGMHCVAVSDDVNHSRATRFGKDDAFMRMSTVIGAARSKLHATAECHDQNHRPALADRRRGSAQSLGVSHAVMEVAVYQRLVLSCQASALRLLLT